MENKQSILRAVTLVRSNRKPDNSVSLTFVTEKEQSSQEFLEIDELRQTGGVLYYKSGGVLSEMEIAAIEKVKIKPESKSKSQRLRGALWHLHQSLNIEMDFETFYAGKMEGIISYVKEEIECT